MLTSFSCRRWPAAVAALVTLGAIGACSQNADQLLSPSLRPTGPSRASAGTVTLSSSSGVVISQVYGGGGNAGSTYRNDFIELYNGGSSSVDLTGSSVQYASTGGTTWTNKTDLTGVIAPGHFYLIQEAAGAGGTTNLPTPDAIGAGTGIAMAAGAGKVALVNSTTALTGTGCPFAATVIDFVGYGTGTNCSETSPTASIGNPSAAIRKLGASGGLQDTGNNNADFTAGTSTPTPTPRNSASPVLAPANALAATIAPSNPSVLAGATVNFTASAAQGGQPVAVTSSAWTSSNTAVATIDPATGVATSIAAGSTTIGVTVQTANGPAASTTLLTVTAPAAPITKVTVSPTTWSLKVNATKTFTATATDAGSNPVATTFAWTSSDPAIATIDPVTGLATGKAVGTATITATSPNNVSGTATITVTPITGNISVQSRPAALPVGFQTQLFLSSGTDAFGNPVANTDVTWSSSDATIVSVNATTGVITAKGINPAPLSTTGTAVITATAKSDGVTTGSTTITTNVAVTGAARIGHNTELGTPTDANPSDDIIIARRQYTTSYNPTRGVTNWVSWNLDATHQGGAPRCNCFTADTALTRLGLPAYDTNDWINNGTNGQYSRGHMSPSADWADADGDNAPTFFLTNMLPQNQAMNGGPWGTFENYLRTRTGNGAEIYIISGGIFTPGRGPGGAAGFGTISNAGKVAIPDSIWKIAVIVSDTTSVGRITSAAQIEVIAINTPNVAPAAGAVWQDYATTIAKIQRSTGYDFLAALADNVECRAEGTNCAPTAAFTTSASPTEGTPVAFDGTSSIDPDGDALTYAWTFGDGTSATGATPSHTYADNGTYAVSLTVSDGKGGTASTTKSVVVANAAPDVALAGTTPNATTGQPFNVQVRFRDAGAKDAPWKIAINWGDGSANFTTTSLIQTWTTPLTRGHAYAAAGAYTVTVTVTDKNNATTTATLAVTVQ